MYLSSLEADTVPSFLRIWTEKFSFFKQNAERNPVLCVTEAGGRVKEEVDLALCILAVCYTVLHCAILRNNELCAYQKTAKAKDCLLSFSLTGCRG